MKPLAFGRLKTLLGGLFAAALFAGCAQQQQQRTYQPAAAPAPKAEPAPAKAEPASGYGPSFATFEQGGIRYRQGSMAFPTGIKSSSGLLLEKVVPEEVLVGQSFEYLYRVSNLTGFDIHQVKVWDRVTPNFRASDADPAATSTDGQVAVWDLGELGAQEVKTIRVRGTAREEGTITTCGWASYSPILCEPIKVTRAALQLVKSAPAEVLICDPIPMKLTVKNTGSSALSAVKVTDQLPAGLTVDGQSSLSFDAGSLAPGQSREFAFNATAARPGRYVNNASASTAQGLTAEDSTTTVVRAPVLAITCDAPSERFVGRPATVCFTVSNTGDGASPNTTVELPIPAGATFNGATAGGQASGDKVVWNIGTLAPNSNKELCATFVPSTIGTMVFNGTAKSTCAPAVSATCQTPVSGIPAILLEVVDLDDPIEVGKDVVYEITVTNQGSAPGTGIKVTCDLEQEQQYVSGTGATAVTGTARRVEMAPVPSLAAKAKATWRVTIRAAAAGNVRFKVSMMSDQITRPVEETESTNQY